MEKTKETIKLFKGVLLEDKEYEENHAYLDYTGICEKTIPLGFILDRKILPNYSGREIEKIITMVKKEFCVTGREMNNSFHKSWAKVRDASMAQLIVEQIVHYITTYGYDDAGIYDEDTVYIPKEELDVPELEGKLKLMVIHGFTKEELKARVLKFINMGVALKEDTVKQLISITEMFDLTEKDISNIKNKEIKAALYKEYGLFPKDPQEFLRYLVYVTTGDTLIIKNKKLINSIKEAKQTEAVNLLVKYVLEEGMGPLASIFYRYKPIFLAFKSDVTTKRIINQIRRFAPECHKPMKEDYLNSITAKIKHNKPITGGVLRKHLRDVNIFRKARLAYALKFRTTGANSVLYRIRNGRSYATSFEFENVEYAEKILKIVLEEIAYELHKNVDGKKIYIPKNITYTLPSTEKMFTGNIPSGSSVSVDKDMVFGIHWNDIDRHRIDLDLSLINIGGKIGWDSSYRSSSRDILFSGDMTSAGGKNGASELFYVKNVMPGVSLMSVNYYNYDESIPVPFKIMIGEEKMVKIGMNHTLNPNNVKAVSNTIMTEQQKTLGIIVTGKEGCTFYFTESNMESGVSSKETKAVEQARTFLYNYYANSINLNELLELSGAELVEQDECDIDLSPEALEKDTILNLMVSKDE